MPTTITHCTGCDGQPDGPDDHDATECPYAPHEHVYRFDLSAHWCPTCQAHADFCEQP